jgi:hypothetical protein
MELLCPHRRNCKQDRQCVHNVTLRDVRVTTVSMEKQQELNILCVCILALVMQRAKRMRPIILSPVACVAVWYIATLSHKRHDFRGKKVINL